MYNEQYEPGIYSRDAKRAMVLRERSWMRSLCVPVVLGYHYKICCLDPPPQYCLCIMNNMNPCYVCLVCIASQDSAFLQDALTIPWTLSTSQQPQQQTNRGFDIGIPEVRETVSKFKLLICWHGKCCLLWQAFDIYLAYVSREACLPSPSWSKYKLINTYIYHDKPLILIRTTRLSLLRLFLTLY